MAAHNRYLRGEKNVMYATCRGDTNLEAGDMCWLYNETALVGIASPVGRVASNQVMPIDQFTTASINDYHTHYAWLYFCGIAMESSPSGVTDQVAIATAGEFRMPLSTAVNVTAGYKVSMVSTTQGGTRQQLQKCAAALGTSSAVGIITKTASGASFVDFRLITQYSAATRCSNVGV